MKYGIISDVHSDIKSLNKVINELNNLNADKIFCCGDIVGYGNSPDAVLKIIIENNISSVAGNHEKALFNEEDYLDMNEKAQIAINENIDYLSENDLNYFQKLSNFLIHNNMRFVHGIPPDSYKNYLHYLSYVELKALFKLYDEQIVFCGHTHLFSMVNLNKKRLLYNKDVELGKPYNIEQNKRYIINVGSVSLHRDPLKKNKSQFVLYDSEKSIIEFCEI